MGARESTRPTHDVPAPHFIPTGRKPTNSNTRTPPPRLFHPGGMGAHELHPTRAPSLASFIPEGWEPIAPGRAKHAPGDNAHHDEHAPRQGCEGSRSFNPSRVVDHLPPATRGRFAPRATRSHASGVKASRRDANENPHTPHTTRLPLISAQRDGNPRTPPNARPLPRLFHPEGMGADSPGSCEARTRGQRAS